MYTSCLVYNYREMADTGAGQSEQTEQTQPNGHTTAPQQTLRVRKGVREGWREGWRKERGGGEGGRESRREGKKDRGRERERWMGRGREGEGGEKNVIR